MSKYYGQVIGAAETSAGRRGYHDIRASAQTWNGSIIAVAKDKSYGQEEVEFIIEISDDSSAFGKEYFIGTLDELKERLSDAGVCYNDGAEYYDRVFECSVCGDMDTDGIPNYCSNCGRKVVYADSES